MSFQSTLIHPFDQSEPIEGGASVKVGSGVGVSGAGVEEGSPTATVVVGTGVSVMVAVGGIVQVGNTFAVGGGRRCGAK